MKSYIVHWGEMGSRWGVNRSVAQIHALLYLSSNPLHAEEISETLGVARSNVSASLKQLLSWDLIRISHVLGDRRDHFETSKDVWEIFTTIVAQRKKREIDPTLNLLRRCQIEAENDRETPQEVKDRIREMRDFLETLTGWYEQMLLLPRASLVKIMKLGGQISRLFGI